MSAALAAPAYRDDEQGVGHSPERVVPERASSARRTGRVLLNKNARKRVGKHVSWPPDYAAILHARSELLERLKSDPELLLAARLRYASGYEGCIAFIQDWCVTYDPRNVGKPDKLTNMPFILFPRQKEAVQFIIECIDSDANGLFEKSRDMGLTWICACISVWYFLFHDGSAIGWGSRKANLVDELGIMDSIFEKIRFILRTIPRVFLPERFDLVKNMAYMRIYCHGTGSSISGESGDGIGRGGRKRVYFKDESAHYEHPDAIEAALSENTRCQIDISSVNGLGNPFERKRSSGQMWQAGVPLAQDKTNVFVVDWRDHPDKTQEWYDTRERLFVGAGLEHVFRQEVDRDYSAAVVGTIIPAAHVRACIDAHRKLGIEVTGAWGASLDIADGGGDTNAFGMRHGIVLCHVEEWGARDTGVTTRRAIVGCSGKGRITLQYDAVGMGSNVKAEVNRLRDDGKMPPGILCIPWMAGGKPLRPDARVNPYDPQSPKNKDFHKNLKAQGWFNLAHRCELTYRAVRQSIDPDFDPGFTWDAEDLISFDSESIPNQVLKQLEKELSQPVWKDSTDLKRVVDKTPEGTKSPNLGDMVMMLYWPAAVPVFNIPQSALNQLTRRPARRHH